MPDRRFGTVVVPVYLEIEPFGGELVAGKIIRVRDLRADLEVETTPFRVFGDDRQFVTAGPERITIQLTGWLIDGPARPPAPADATPPPAPEPEPADDLRAPRWGGD